MSQLIVFDLEFTAWADSLAGQWLAPGQFKEAVQIGAVRLNLQALRVTANFDCLVKPRIEGVDFTAALRRFAAFADDSVIAAFGHDEWVLEDNIRLYGLYAGSGRDSIFPSA